MITEALYQDYFQALVAGDGKRCRAIVTDLLEKKIDIRELYLHLFQASLYEIGRLWEENKISVAVEHLATAITEGLLNLVYPILFSTERIGKSVIIACIPKELHQVGAKMIADIFELNGWDSYFLGSNTPISGLLTMIEEKQPDLVGLSMSIYFNLQQLLQLLSVIREAFPNLRLIVGGQGFRWGGAEKIKHFKNAEYIDSIHTLEKYVNER